jgi:ATP-dependent exoDNAse (exonuclease V) beta subunit
MLITGKPHISFSEMKDWKECSFRHKLKYIDQVGIGEMNTAVCFGSAVHSACENFLLTRSMNVQVCFDELEKLWNENSSIKEFSVQSLNDAKKDAEEILNDIPNFMEETFPNWELVEAEKQLYVEIKDYKIKSTGLDVYFKGYIDGIIKIKDDKGNEQFWILDWKTSNLGWKPDKKQHPDTKMQLVLYKHYFSSLTNIPLKDIRCGYVILKKKYKPGKKCELFSISIGETPIQNSLSIIKNMLTSLDKGIAIKNRLSCHYCDYYMSEYCK